MVLVYKIPPKGIILLICKHVYCGDEKCLASTWFMDPLWSSTAYLAIPVAAFRQPEPGLFKAIPTYTY